MVQGPGPAGSLCLQYAGSIKGQLVCDYTQYQHIHAIDAYLPYDMF
jgi:hypothetical protein